MLHKATLEGTPEGQEALAELCRRYRPPVERFIRARSPDPQKVGDLAQGFFLRFLRQRLWQRADRSKGRFRSYLFTAVNHYLISEHRTETTEGRGGGRTLESLDELWGNGFEPAGDAAEPGELFDYQWALQLLRLASAQLRHTFHDEPEKFAVLERFLPAAVSPLNYAAAAELLGTNEPGVRKMVSRLRQQLSSCFRNEVARTVEPHELEEELRYLLGLLVKPPQAA